MTTDRRCPVCQLPLVYIREATRETTRPPWGTGKVSERAGFAVYRCVAHGVWRVYNDGRIQPNDTVSP
jgi:hypothetical protein